MKVRISGFFLLKTSAKVVKITEPILPKPIEIEAYYKILVLKLPF